MIDKRCFGVIVTRLMCNSPTAKMRLLKLTREVSLKPCESGWVRRVHTPGSLSLRGNWSTSAVLLPTKPPPTTNTRSLPNRRMPGRFHLASRIGDSCCHLHAPPPPPLRCSPPLRWGRLVRSAASFLLPPPPPTTRTAASSSPLPIISADWSQLALDIFGRSVHLGEITKMLPE